jgi:hypothetical protein
MGKATMRYVTASIAGNAAECFECIACAEYHFNLMSQQLHNQLCGCIAHTHGIVLHTLGMHKDGWTAGPSPTCVMPNAQPSIPSKLQVSQAAGLKAGGDKSPVSACKHVRGHRQAFPHLQHRPGDEM